MIWPFKRKKIKELPIDSDILLKVYVHITALVSPGACNVSVIKRHNDYLLVMYNDTFGTNRRFVVLRLSPTTKHLCKPVSSLTAGENKFFEIIRG